MTRTPVTDETRPVDTVDEPQPEDTRPRRRRSGKRFGLVAVLTPWILVVALAAVIGVWLLPSYLEYRDVQQREAAVEQATIELMRQLTNWDATDGLEDTRDALAEIATGDFRDQIDELFAGPVAADLEASGATSSGEIEQVYVQDITDARAETFAVVTQTISTSDPESTTEIDRRASIALRYEDGQWKASVVEIADGVVPLTPAG